MDINNDAEKSNQQVDLNVQSDDFLVSSVNKEKNKLLDINRITLPDQLKTQYSFRKLYLVSVMTFQPGRGSIEAIYDTWARDVANIKFFTSPTDTASQLNIEGIPIVQLPPLTDKGHDNKAFQVLEYLHLYHLNDYEWFVLTPDDTYVNPQGLEELLSHLDPNTNTYIGHPVTSSKEASFCLAGPGIVLSRAAVENLVPKLDRCKTNTSNSNNWDEELGRCLGNQLKIQCAREASEVSTSNSIEQQ